jgi:two-component system, chemotaxis family, protein-glutamate methylesterase/glutaminase
MPNQTSYRRAEIVVIGGSAGALEPLKRIVARLPPSLTAALFVVIHVSSDSPSVLPEILSSTGSLPSLHPSDGQRIENGTIYVAPPDRHLLIGNGFIKVTRGPRENRHRPAVDPLFRTAARAYGDRVMGIVLSGHLDDGSAGLMAVKIRGGLGIVQDPSEAFCPEMPSRALHYASADYVLQAEEIGELLSRSASNSSGDSSGMPMHNIAEADKANLEIDANREKEGKPSPFACPECHGVLWEMDEGKMLRFRCRVGHAYTAAALNSAFSESTEDALWASMRSLEEKAALLRRLANRSVGDKLAAAYEEEAAASDKHVESIRRMLIEKQEEAA